MYSYEILPNGGVQKWYADIRIGAPMTSAEAEIAKAEDQRAAKQAAAGRIARFGHSQIPPAWRRG